MNEAVLLMIHLASTLFMVGVIWFVQIVHYPLMAYVGRDLFRDYAKMHQNLTTYVVAGPMLMELATAVCLWINYPILRHSWSYQASLFLLALIWLSTLLLQVPLHRTLLAGYDELTIRRLVLSNWCRTLAWSLRGILIGELFWSLAVFSLGLS